MKISKRNVGEKKPLYKRVWVWVIIVIMLLSGACSGGEENKDTSDTSNNTQIEEQTEEETQEEAEEVEEEKTPEEIASEMGRYWFQSINWDSVFSYKCDIHYIIDYTCRTTPDELKEYGKYVAMAGADLQNGFGAEFTSKVYIFMDKDGIITHIFYDEADGSSIEIPLDNIPVNCY